jgi:HAD superfamily hydrolase (TIGR01509 family)
MSVPTVESLNLKRKPLKITLPTDREIRGLIFDMDGTLAHTMPVHYLAWLTALGEHGVEFAEDYFYSLGGTPPRTIVQILNEQQGADMDPEAVASYKEHTYMDLVGEALPIEEVISLAREYHGKMPLSVATGSIESVALKTLKGLGILELFDAVVCAEHYERGKPHPDPFLVAAEKMGVPAEHCVVFEDSWNGIKGAKAAGTMWVHVDTRPIE